MLAVAGCGGSSRTPAQDLERTLEERFGETEVRSCELRDGLYACTVRYAGQPSDERECFRRDGAAVRIVFCPDWVRDAG